MFFLPQCSSWHCTALITWAFRRTSLYVIKGSTQFPFFFSFGGYLWGTCLLLQQTQDASLCVTSFIHWGCRCFLQAQLSFKVVPQWGFAPRHLPSNSSRSTSPLCHLPFLSFCKISFPPTNAHLFYPSSLVPHSFNHFWSLSSISFIYFFHKSYIFTWTAMMQMQLKGPWDSPRHWNFVIRRQVFHRWIPHKVVNSTSHHS